jgi:hypothetical protein
MRSGSREAIAVLVPPRRFRGKHPLKPWPSDAADRPPYQAMPPRSYQLKPWPSEAQRRGWCPFSAPRTRLPIGTPQALLLLNALGSADIDLQPGRDADRTRIAKTRTLPPGAKPTADAPSSILTPHPSKRFQLRRPSEREGGVCCKPQLGSTRASANVSTNSVAIQGQSWWEGPRWGPEETTQRRTNTTATESTESLRRPR